MLIKEDSLDLLSPEDSLDLLSSKVSFLLIWNVAAIGFPSPVGSKFLDCICFVSILFINQLSLLSSSLPIMPCQTQTTVANTEE